LWFIGSATQYWQFLVLGLLVGVAGASFTVGIAYTSKWFDTFRLKKNPCICHQLKNIL
jgi:nitrate/nitrite transporter NarK